MKKILLALFIALPVFAAEEKIQLTVGESKIIQVDAPKKIAVGNPAVADVKALSEKEILLIGKASGSTTFIVWDKDNVQATNQVIVLESTLEKAMIEVNAQVLEIKKTNNVDYGIDWKETVKALDFAEKTIPAVFQISDFERLKKIGTKIDLLLENGYAKVLAKPRLLAISGKKAKFLAGGELPVLKPDSDGNVTVEWKDFGVKMDIQPTADAAENINCDIKVEVSNLDSSAGASYNGNIIPALKTRWVDTTIYVKKGGTIVIGGLLQEEETKREEGVPILSSLPLIGLLFRNTHIEKQETELVIFVTPSIVGK